jgi:chromosome segregation ATPase
MEQEYMDTSNSELQDGNPPGFNRWSNDDERSFRSPLAFHSGHPKSSTIELKTVDLRRRMDDLQADNRTLTAQLERAKKDAEETKGELQTAKTKYFELKVEADQAVEAARRKEEAAYAHARQLEAEVDQLRNQVT